MLEILYTIYYLWNKKPIISSDNVNRDYTIVYIHGAGHCGSTLLNLLLNAHSNITGLSEISKLHKVFMDNKEESDSTLLESDFWQSVITKFEGRLGEPLLSDENRFKIYEWSEYFDLDKNELARIQNVNRVFFDSIYSHTKHSVICDASKFLVRLHLLISSGLPIKTIHLDRDGRGILQSYLRKGHIFRNAFRRWNISETGLILLNHWLPRNSLYYCRYEKLAEHPDKELKKICVFLGITYEDTMVTEFRRTENMGIRGNRMRHSDDSSISVDRSWKKLLPFQEKIKFWLYGGWIHWPTRLWVYLKRR